MRTQITKPDPVLSSSSVLGHRDRNKSTRHKMLSARMSVIRASYVRRKRDLLWAGGKAFQK